MRRRAVTLLLAVGLDLALGEPPPRWHPVVWIGRALERADRRARSRDVGEGLAALSAVAGLAWGAAALVAWVGRRLGPLGVLLEAAALKPAFAVRRLGAAAREVACALRAGDIDEARRRVGSHLVSRETSRLSVPEVVSATVESVAENLADSVAAPLLAYAVGGLAAAWLYRSVNTADAMWGYRDARYERFGKAAARVDDALNLLPARLAAAALAAGAGLAGEDAAGAVRIARRDHARTPSPNAGWTMAAMAGALGVRLEKPGVYRLGDGPPPEVPGVIGRALGVFAVASALAIAGTLALVLWRGEGGRS